MRDIKTLKSTEQVKISTGKELKKFCKLIDFRNLIIQAPCFYTQNEHGRGFSSDDNKLKTFHVADFLPKKKKKATKEWVEKYVAKALYAKQTQEAVERALQPSKEQISDLVTTDPANLDVNGAEVVSGLEEGTVTDKVDIKYTGDFCRPIVPEIDWNVKQLVKSKSSSLVIAYTGQHNDYEFSGFVVIDTEKQVFGTGLSSLTWVKSEFEPYTIPNEN